MNKSFPIAEIAASDEVGQLGLMHLKRYWSKMLLKLKRGIEQDSFSDEWSLDNILISVIGAGIYQTAKYLFEARPSFEQFEDWILEINGGTLNADKVRLFNDMILGLGSEDSTKIIDYQITPEEWEFWNENGYLIIKNAVSKENCQAAVAVICDFLKISMDNPDSWYQSHSALQGIMVQLFQHPVLQENRESKKVRAVYQQLYRRSDLWLNTDKVGFNPPETSSYKFKGTGLHWDVSLERPIPFGLQGILYLTDTAENQGAFTCVPGFHRQIDSWLEGLLPEADPRAQPLEIFGARAIAAAAGDFIVWHHALPHAASPNLSTLPRFVQYVNYQSLSLEMRGWK